MIETTYYNKAKFGDLAISTGNFKYAKFAFKKILCLAPSEIIGKNWRDLQDDEYIFLYKKGLKKINPCEILGIIKENNFGALVCFEKYDKFCHRHIVAKWLFDELGEQFKERDLPKGWVFDDKKFLYRKKDEPCLNLLGD